MAQCEKCGLKGYDRREMGVDQTGKLLVGPCCLGKIAENELEYGVKLSSRTGLTAYVQGGGLQVVFTKSPDELKKLFDSED